MPIFSNFEMLKSGFTFCARSEKNKMATAIRQLKQENFLFSSSVASDVWHPKPSGESFEWWYFDALSDDGSEAVVIIFLDNFIFSPQYNSAQSSKTETQSSDSKIKSPKSVPAVAFVYYRDGKPCYRAINEFAPEDFSASRENPECRIGDNFFRFEAAPYGSGYVLSINTKLRKNRRLEAHFEWLSIESDFLPNKEIEPCDSHCWNLVATRSDVTGKISVSDKRGKNADSIHFRGTGYHDHNFDNRWLPETVSDWQWGRAHFSDSTAVFYRYKEIDEPQATTKLFTVCNGELTERDAVYREEQFSRHFFGIRYPHRLSFETEDGMSLRVNQNKIIDASFFYLRFLSEIIFTLPDGKQRETLGITEYLMPKALKYRWLDWLVNMRIGKNGKGSFLP